MGSHAHCLAEFIEGLGTAQVDLFGHSAGGAIAIEAAVLARGRVRRLILSEPNLDPGGGVFSCRIASETEQNFVACGHARMVRETLDDGNSAWASSLAASLPVAVHRMAVSLVAGSVPSWREQIRAVSAVRRREEIGGTGAKHVRRRIADTGCCSKPRYGDGAYGD